MFKVIVLLAFVAAASAYRWTDHGFPPGSVDDLHAETTHLVNDVRADGFHYGVESNNNIKATATGDEHGNIDGGFEWISPEGYYVKFSYVADENGYQPSSDILPTPPPVPEAIIKSLEYIRTHPQKEVYSGKQ